MVGRRFFRRVPTELLGRRLQDGPQPRVFQVLQPERERILLDRLGQVVDVAFAGEMVGRRRQRPVRALPQRGLRGVKGAALVRDFVERAQGRGARVVVGDVPRGQRAVVADSARQVDHASRAKIGPGEFLFPRPGQLHRFAGRLGKPGRLDGRFGRVLAAVAGTHVRRDDADFLLRHVERQRQLAPHAEGTLRSRPDGQLSILPFGHRGPRLQRRMGDIGDGVSRLVRVVGRRQALFDRPAVEVRAAAEAETLAPRVRFLEIVEQVLIGDGVRRRRPLRLEWLRAPARRAAASLRPRRRIDRRERP